jgi:probable F420-dependent oxidoreductase
VLVLPQRPTALVAKQAAEVDFLSGGRLRLGLGVGETPLEMQALGYDYHSRGKRFEEQIHVLRELWTNPLVTFKGVYHQIEGMGLNPLPVQQPIPIWFGGAADVVIRRMARLGDGWMLNVTYPEEAIPLIEKLQRYLRDTGRNRDEFGIDIRINLSKHPRETWANLVDAWRELPITYIGVNTMGSGFRYPQDHINAIRVFKEETSL